ncbi:MAG: hypothetical protein II943_12665 [Victivallales bacterium]|nr:hypothetical protein [Victivallales bacterium]
MENAINIRGHFTVVRQMSYFHKIQKGARFAFFPAPLTGLATSPSSRAERHPFSSVAFPQEGGAFQKYLSSTFKISQYNRPHFRYYICIIANPNTPS